MIVCVMRDAEVKPEKGRSSS